MVYETNGPSVNGVQTREVRRLEYRSRTDGKETVIEAPNVVLAISKNETLF
jgi:hypothetical protein